MGFYSKHLGDTLKQAVEDMLNQPVGMQINLFEELALVRTQAVCNIKLWNMAVESPEPDDKTIRLAMELVSESLGQVKEFCLAVSRIEKDAEGKVGMQIVQVFIDQIVRVIFHVCGEENEALAKKIQAGIAEGVKLPKSADEIVVEGTDLTPDQTVTEMDELSAPEPEGASDESAEDAGV